MPTTVSASTMAKQPIVLPSGANVISCSVTAGQTMTSTEVTVFKLFKLPHRAIIDLLVTNHSGSSATAPIDIGFKDALSTFASAVALGDKIAATAIGYQVSLSDDAAIQFRTVTVAVTPGTTTNTILIKAVCIYHMP